MEANRGLQLGDLIDVSGLKKPDDLTLIMRSEAKLASARLSKIASKINANEDLHLGEIRALVQVFATALKENTTLYYQDQKVGKDDLIIYKKVLEGNLSDGEQVRVLTPKIARAMLKKIDMVLYNVRCLSKESADVLANYNDRLRLCLTQLSPAVARELAKTDIYFLHGERNEGIVPKEKYGLDGISAEVARELAVNPRGVHLEMKYIDKDVARELSKCSGMLNLPLIKNISVEVAQELIIRSGGLSLGTLDETTEEVLAVLAQYQGTTLSMNPKSISDKLSEKLANFEGKLSLGCDSQKVKMSEGAVATLAKRRGVLCLAIDEFTVNMARCLSTHEGNLVLPTLVDLTEEMAMYLAKHKEEIDFMHLNGKSYSMLAKYNDQYDS